jgi:hypothetical protein
MVSTLRLPNRLYANCYNRGLTLAPDFSHAAQHSDHDFLRGRLKELLIRRAGYDEVLTLGTRS